MSIAFYYTIFLVITFALFVLAAAILRKCAVTLRTGTAPAFSDFANSLGRVSVVSYCLVNGSIIALLLQNVPTQAVTRENVMSLVASIAWAVLFLGLTLLLILFIFSRLRRLEPVGTGAGPNI